ncbi:MAG: 50S ribosomal protein L29 [Alphaproteobacteria bacterium]|jgi:large subunit ribosomal protein L29|nr:50S ribosomal protein L29 [Alphaproteobacteria bacterium]
MKAQEIRNKTEAELKQDLLKARKELFNIRFQKANGNLENISRIAIVKKDLAKIKTILTEKAKKIR